MGHVPEKSNRILGDVIRSHRKDRGLSQYELADRAGTSANSISSLENGQTGVHLQTLDRLAEALGVRSSYLLGLRDAAMEAQKGGVSRSQVRVVKALGDVSLEGMFAEPVPESERPEVPGDPRDALEMISWVADGLLPGYRFDVVAMVGSDGASYPLPTESAAMANILETTLVKHLIKAVSEGYEGVQPELPRSDRVYPDIAFTGPALGGKWWPAT